MYREPPLSTLVTWGCVERELWDCQATKEPVQHGPLCGQQTGVKGFGDGTAVPIHGFTQNSETLRETREGYYYDISKMTRLSRQQDSPENLRK